jgi:hypothetical protein
MNEEGKIFHTKTSENIEFSKISIHITTAYRFNKI